MKNIYGVMLGGFALLALYASPVLAAVTVTEIMPLSFGMLEIPASGSDSLSIDCDTGTATGTATLIHDTTSRGQYLLASSSASEMVTLDIQNISTGSAVLMLENFKGRYNGQAINSFPASTLLVPQGGATLMLGATLTFTSAVTEQSYGMNFDIVVNYE